MDKETRDLTKKFITKLMSDFNSDITGSGFGDYSKYPELGIFYNGLKKVRSSIKAKSEPEDVIKVIEKLPIESGNPQILAIMGNYKQLLMSLFSVDENGNILDNLMKASEESNTNENGVNGQKGADGVDGKNGVNGQKGVDGVDGKNGVLTISNNSNNNSNNYNYSNNSPMFENISKAFGDAISVIANETSSVLGETKTELIDPVMGLGSAAANLFNTDDDKEIEKKSFGVLSSLFENISSFTGDFVNKITSGVHKGMESTRDVLQDTLDFQEAEEKENDREIKKKDKDKDSGIFGGLFNGLTMGIGNFFKIIPMLLGGLTTIGVGLAAITFLNGDIDTKKIVDSIEGIKEKLLPHLKNLIDALKEAFITLKPMFQSMVKKLLPIIKDFINYSIELLIDGMEMLANGIKALIPKLIKGIEWFKQSDIPGMFSSIFDSIVNIIKNIGKLFIKITKPLLPIMAFLLKASFKFIESIIWIGSIFTTITNKILDNDWGSFFLLPKMITNVLGKFTLFNKIFNFIGKSIDSITKILDFTIKGMDNINEFFKNIGKLGEKFSDGPGMIKKTIGLFDTAVNIIKDVNTLLSKIPVIGKIFYSIGKAFTFMGKFAGIAFKSIQSGLKFLKFLPKLFGKLAWPLTIVMGVIDAIKGFMNTEGGILTKIQAGISTAIKGFIALPLNLIGWLTDKFLGLFGLKTNFTDGLLNFVMKITDFILGIPKMLWDGVTHTFDSMINLGAMVGKSFMWLFGKIFNIMTFIPRMIWKSISGLFNKITDKFSIVKTIKDMINNFALKLKDFLISLIPGAKLFKKMFGEKEKSTKDLERDAEKFNEEKKVISTDIAKLKEQRKVAKFEKDQSIWTIDGPSKEDIDKKIAKLEEKKAKIDEKYINVTNELTSKKESVNKKAEIDKIQITKEANNYGYYDINEYQKDKQTNSIQQFSNEEKAENRKNAKKALSEKLNKPLKDLSGYTAYNNIAVADAQRDLIKNQYSKEELNKQYVEKETNVKKSASYFSGTTKPRLVFDNKESSFVSGDKIITNYDAINKSDVVNKDVVNKLSGDIIVKSDNVEIKRSDTIVLKTDKNIIFNKETPVSILFDDGQIEYEKALSEKSLSEKSSTDTNKLDQLNQITYKEVLSRTPSAATGGLINNTGLVNVHAGEVIGPLTDVRSMIQTETFNEFEDYMNKNNSTVDIKNLKSPSKIDINNVDSINKEIIKNTVRLEETKIKMAHEGNTILEQSRMGMKMGMDSIKKNTEKTTNNTDNSQSINNTLSVSEQVPSTMEDIGVFVTNSGWL